MVLKRIITFTKLLRKKIRNQNSPMKAGPPPETHIAKKKRAHNDASNNTIKKVFLDAERCRTCFFYLFSEISKCP